MGNTCSAVSQTNKISDKQLSQNFNIFQINQSLLNAIQIPNTSQNGKIVHVKENKSTEGQLYIAPNQENRLNNYRQMSFYSLRHQNNLSYPFIKVHGVKQMSSGSLLNSKYWYYVITQKIIPLNQIKYKMSFQQCTYMLFQCLMGYYYLYLTYHDFQITDKMIGVNQYGKVKVWINQNFGKNHPQNQKPLLQLNKPASIDFQNEESQRNLYLQGKIVNQIFDILNRYYQKDNNQNTYETFKEQILNKMKVQLKNRSQKSFIDLLHSIAEFQQRNQKIYFFQNKLNLKELKFDQRLNQRQSFSVRLQKVKKQYYERNPRKIQSRMIIRKQNFQQLQYLTLQNNNQSRLTYQTGKLGNSMGKTQASFVNSPKQPPNVRFLGTSQSIYSLNNANSNVILYPITNLRNNFVQSQLLNAENITRFSEIVYDNNQKIFLDDYQSMYSRSLNGFNFSNIKQTNQTNQPQQQNLQYRGTSLAYGLNRISQQIYESDRPSYQSYERTFLKPSK